MIRLEIRAIGTIPKDWHTQAIHSYIDRLKPHVKLMITELPEGHGGSSKPNVAKTREIEAEKLLNGILPNAFVIACDESGESLDSPTFAKRLASAADQGQSVVIVIGGSWGLDGSVRERANLTLSFGRLTLPHALFRIVLLEQIYRAILITSGKEYHK